MRRRTLKVLLLFYYPINISSITYMEIFMKLDELKIALIQQFFKSSDDGIEQSMLSEVFESLAKSLNVDLKNLPEQNLTEDNDLNSGVSCEPSKAFRKFTEGRRALLSINEDNGNKKMAIFAALRVGTEIIYRDLTEESQEDKKGNLASIKQALKQAKNINDDIYFNIQNDDHGKI